jgi:hypothetical protein
VSTLYSVIKKKKSIVLDKRTRASDPPPGKGPGSSGWSDGGDGLQDGERQASGSWQGGNIFFLDWIKERAGVGQWRLPNAG